mmetsp:Transcript_8489/g.20462  ORF Transcript_8489/g.20462 Transcript_8489/m.20462 type:complete len:333 (+) Transcript_8489:1107-2105(+)
MRHLRQPAEAGGLEAKNHRQDDGGGAHGKAGARSTVHVPLPQRREIAATSPRLRGGQLRLQREETGLPLRRVELRGGPGFADRACGSERGWEVDPSEADAQGARSVRGGGEEARPLENWAVQPALRGGTRPREVAAAVLRGTLPRRNHHGERKRKNGRRRLAKNTGQVRYHRKLADEADEDDVAWVPDKGGVCDDLPHEPAHSSSRRTDQPLGHAVYRFPGRRNQRLHGRASARFPRLSPHRPGGERSVGVRQQNGGALERRYQDLQGPPQKIRHKENGEGDHMRQRPRDGSVLPIAYAYIRGPMRVFDCARAGCMHNRSTLAKVAEAKGIH